MRNDRASQAGFTLLELMVIAIVIAIISSIGIIALMGALDRAKQRATIADMRTVSRAMAAYQVDSGFLPDDSGGLAALVGEMIPYTTNVLPTRDHWGNDLNYARDVAGNYSLTSFGKDGADGTDLVFGDRFNYDGDIIVYNGVFVAAPD